MAEETGQERTEEPTEKRLRDAREKGDIPRSRELTTTILLVAAAIGGLLFGSSVVSAMSRMMGYNFSLDRESISDPMMMVAHLTQSMYESLLAIAGIIGLLVLAALIGPIALGGWNFSNEALMPKGSRINPLSGIKRMFSLNSLVELVKAIAKFTLVATIAVVVLLHEQPQIAQLAKESVRSAMAHSVDILLWSFLLMSLAMIVITAIDVPYQLYSYRKKLMMTLQEIKDEMKNTEGKPEVKGKLRQMQREMSQRKMMKDIPEADVVITNPTHYAVAVKYDPDVANAPVVVAKGADFIALKIREIATEHKVPILESPALARALYHAAEIGDEVPTGLYKSVAQVLAYVFQLRRYIEKPAGDEPEPPKENEIEIPEDYRVDPEP